MWHRDDVHGRVVREDYGDGTHRNYTYDPVGNLVYTENQAGEDIRQVFSGGDRLLERILNGTTQATTRQLFEYDGLGRLTRATDDNVLGLTSDDSVVERFYDSLGRLTRESQNGYEVQSGYDGVGNRVELVRPGGQVLDYEFDALGRMTDVADPSGSLYSFSYEGGRRTSAQAANGVESTWSYDGAQRLIGVSTSNHSRIRRRVCLLSSATTMTWTGGATASPATWRARRMAGGCVGGALTGAVMAPFAATAATARAAVPLWQWITASAFAGSIGATTGSDLRQWLTCGNIDRDQVLLEGFWGD